MGGTTFEQYQDGSDARAAFRDAQDVAGHEHGYGGYSGTIVEKPGFTIIQHQPVNYAEASALADRLINANDPRVDDKWGNAGAIPVSKEAESNLAEKSMTVRTGTFDGDWQKRLNELKVIAADRLSIPLGSIVDLTIVADTPGPVRVKAEAPKEKTETRYTITNSQHGNWSTGLTSQADARAEAVRLAEADSWTNRHSDVTNYEVESVTRRVTGEPLVRVQRVVTRHDLELKVTYRKGKVASSGRIDGWYFFGWASC